jgi:hypothetical protein
LTTTTNRWLKDILTRLFIFFGYRFYDPSLRLTDFSSPMLQVLSDAARAFGQPATN